MQVGGAAISFSGAKEFCSRAPSFCRPSGEKRVQLTKERWDQLNRINLQVNNQIKPMEDIDNYGVEEYWTIPTKAGDCEDYSILKKKRLVAAGWPSASLLITVVFYGKVGHAVLAATTSQGDLILDNRRNEIREWHSTEYRYLQRQSQNSSGWVSIH